MAKQKNNTIKTKQELQLLREIIETISYNLDLKEVLSRIVKIVSGVTKADSCFLYLIDGNKLILRASLNPKPLEIGHIKLELNEGITGWVATNKKTVAIASKAYNDKRFKLINSLPEDRFEGFLSVPIIYHDKVLGVINVQHCKPREYSKTRSVFLSWWLKPLAAQLKTPCFFRKRGAQGCFGNSKNHRKG